MQPEVSTISAAKPCLGNKPRIYDRPGHSYSQDGNPAVSRARRASPPPIAKAPAPMSHAPPAKATPPCGVTAPPGRVELPVSGQPAGHHTTEIDLRLMGSFELAANGRPINLPVSAQRLIALLALEGRSMARCKAAGILWPDKAESRAAANLRSTLWRLNSHLDDIVFSDNGFVALTESVIVDIDYLFPAKPTSITPCCEADLEMTSAERTHPPQAISPLTATVLANAGRAAELLVDWYDDWVIVERERIRQQTLRALESASTDLRRRGHFPAAIDAGVAAIKLAPLRESSHRVVIKAHLAEGNYSEAVRQYEAFAAILSEGLGVSPSAALGELLVDHRNR